MKELASFYRGKKVFLTGHTGFKGSWLIQILNLMGATVKGYALAPEKEEDHFHLIKGNTLCESVIADIRDYSKLENELVEFAPDIVIHMAAQPLVIKGYESPLYTYEVNVMGTANVLNAVKTYGSPCLVLNVTTDKVYENLETLRPYKEDDRLGGYDPYSNSKACSELVTASFRSSFFNASEYNKHGVSLASARSGNVIGGGDWADNRIVPDIARALLNNKEITVRNPKAIRPWQHVLDPLYGYLLLLQKMTNQPVELASGFNFGPREKDELTVDDLVNCALDNWEGGNYSSPNLTNQPHEAGLLKLDIQKAKQELNWSPQLEAKEAIAWTMEWYKSYPENASATTLLQIKRYFNL